MCREHVLINADARVSILSFATILPPLPRLSAKNCLRQSIAGFLHGKKEEHCEKI